MYRFGCTYYICKCVGFEDCRSSVSQNIFKTNVNNIRRDSILVDFQLMIFLC